MPAEALLDTRFAALPRLIRDATIPNASASDVRHSMDYCKRIPPCLRGAAVFSREAHGFVLVRHAGGPTPSLITNGGSIVNNASVNAYRGSPHLIDYSATKGAIVAFTRSLALSIADKGIRVNAVARGPMWTPLIRAARIVHHRANHSRERRRDDQWLREVR
jgi:NAD(P)-dependent dehydrogenase (short-subunit alcohol dehydrogenase family)